MDDAALAECLQLETYEFDFKTLNELCHQVSEEEIYGADIATGTSASTGGKDIVLDTAGEATVLHQGHDAVEEYTKDASEKEKLKKTNIKRCLRVVPSIDERKNEGREEDPLQQTQVR